MIIISPQITSLNEQKNKLEQKRELNEKDEEIRVLRESMSMMKKDFLELQDRMRAGEAIFDEWKSTVEKTQHDIQQERR